MEQFQQFLDSLLGSVGDKVPGILGAVLVLIIGLLIAGGVKRLIRGILKRTNVDDRLASKLNLNFRLDTFISKIAYYLIVVYVLILVLDMMGVQSVLEPLQNMLNEFLGFLPNLIAAGLIGFAGYIIATLASEATGVLAGSVERFSSKAGLQSSIDLSKLVKQLVFILVFIPILVVALDSLKMKAISEPATQMLETLMNAIPNILAAAIIIGVFYVAGRYVTNILTDLMSNLGVDQMSSKLGLSSIVGDKTSLSKLVGNIAFFFLMFSGIIAALDKLELTSITTMLNQVMGIAGNIFFGLILLVLGNIIAGVAVKAVSANEENAWMSGIIRFAIMGIFIAIALHTMGIGQSIVNLAFGLTLGALAVAFALSFGLGGREAAGKHLDYILKQFRDEE